MRKNPRVGRGVGRALLGSGLLLSLIFACSVPRAGAAGFEELRGALRLWDRIVTRESILGDLTPHQQSVTSSALRAAEERLVTLEGEQANPFLPFGRGLLRLSLRDQPGAHRLFTEASRLAGDRIGVRWVLYRRFSAWELEAEAERELQALLRLKARLGLERIGFIGADLRAWARQALRAGDRTAAGTLMDRAALFDPGSPDLEFLQGELSTQQIGLGMLRGVSHYWRGWLGSWQDLTQGPARLANLLTGVLRLSFNVLALFAFVLLFRALSLLDHDLMEAKVRVDPRTRRLLPLCLLSLPLWVGLDLMAICFLGLIPLAVYVGRRERRAFYLFVGVLIFFPMLYAHAGRLVLLVGSSPLQHLAQVERGEHGTGLLSALEAWQAEGPAAALRARTLALVLRRRGELRRARTLTEEALRMLPDDPGLLNNLGNIRFLQGDLSGAEQAYRRALTMDAQAPFPAFHLSQLLTDRLELEEAQRALAVALEGRPDLARWLRHVPLDRGERMLIDVTPTPQEVWKTLLPRERGLWELSEALWGAPVAGIALAELPWVAIAYVGLFAISVRLRGRRPHARRCESCGRAYCPLCSRAVGQQELCTRCVMLERVSATGLRGISPGGTAVAPPWTWVLPGLPLLSRGQPLRGCLLLWVTLGLVWLLLPPHRFATAVLRLPTMPLTGALAAGGLILLGIITFRAESRRRPLWP